MINKKKIAVITGSRSEFGILYWVIKKLKEHPNIECQLIVTGSHLAMSQGETINEINEAKIEIDATVPMLLDGDSGEQLGYSMGLGVIGMTKELARLKPQMIVVLGDRFEIFSACMAAMAMQIPIAHIGGGETDWANCIDGNIRNAITKMAHIHFVSHELYRDRIRKMGEQPERIFNVGLPSLDSIKNDLMTKQELEQNLGIKFKKNIFLITYLTVGLREEESLLELEELFEALKYFASNTTIIFTLSNADAGGRKINKKIIEFSNPKESVYVVQSLGRKRYLSMINICDVVIGNSSSGIIEVPSFNKPTVNIGIRQEGRVHPQSVITVRGEKDKIIAAIRKALGDEEFKKQLKELVNPFGDGTSSVKIANVLNDINIDTNFIEKKLV